MTRRSPSEVEARFWKRVLRNDASGCWEFIGPKQKGYGVVARNGGTTPAHRYSYELAHGPIPSGLLVCHKCDNHPCVNPEHLFLGTQKDNMQDCAKKGRLNTCRGEAARARVATKLTPEKVRAIRARYAQGDISCARLAPEFGVYKSTIERVVNRKRWTDIQ